MDDIDSSAGSWWERLFTGVFTEDAWNGLAEVKDRIGTLQRS